MSITEIENKFHQEGMNYGREQMKEHLERLDEELCKNRDKKRYRDKGRRKTVLKTKMGDLEYERKLYLDTAASEYVYLLDDELGIGVHGKISPGLAALAVQEAAKSSYREATKSLQEMTGTTISHQTTWALTQAVGEELRKRPHVSGEVKSKVLYEENDGVYLRMQGKDRRGSSKGMREMKLGIAYAGIQKNGKRRSCAEKVAYGAFETAEEFFERKEREISRYYDVTSIEQRIYNGDGAGWIMDNSIVEGRWQLDVFHRNRAIRTYLNVPEMQQQCFQFLKRLDIDGLLGYLEACMNSSQTAEEYKDRKTLYIYLKNNREYLIPYTKSDLALLPLNDGLVPAKMGAMESNVYTQVAGRMKNRRCCWSIKGANHLVTILCLKHTGRLEKALQEISLPKMEEQSPPILLSHQVQKSVGKGYDGFMQADVRPTKKTKYLPFEV